MIVDLTGKACCCTTAGFIIYRLR